MQAITRRRFSLAVAGGVHAALLGASARSCTASEDRVPVVDTHLHCFGGITPPFPYHNRAPYRPVKVASPEHLLQCMDEGGVDYAVVVHPEPDQGKYPHRDVRPIILQLTNAFGPERMIYGGGFGADATGDSYRAYRGRAAALLAHLSDQERSMILGGNAAKLFRFA